MHLNANSVSFSGNSTALIVTGVLSDRNRLYQQTVLQQQAKLAAQEKLASVREDFASAEECAQQLTLNHPALHLLLFTFPLVGGIFYSRIAAWLLPINDAHELFSGFSKAFSTRCSLTSKNSFSTAEVTKEG